jgi:hypothetical protein
MNTCLVGDSPSTVNRLTNDGDETINQLSTYSPKSNAAKKKQFLVSFCSCFEDVFMSVYSVGASESVELQFFSSTCSHSLLFKFGQSTERCNSWRQWRWKWRTSQFLWAAEIASQQGNHVCSTTRGLGRILISSFGIFLMAI